MKQRIDELDFLKCVFILLMIIFHLVYIGDKYPLVKQWVYTFHMPAFLILSGYLANVKREWRSFFHSMLWIFIPYGVMESGYLLASTVLPVRGSVDSLTGFVWLEKLFLHPVGPYWYLHTLILCSSFYFIADKITDWGLSKPALRRGLPEILCWAILFLCTEAGVRLGILSRDNAYYFMLGVLVRRTGVPFLTVFMSRWWFLLPLCCIWIFLSPEAGLGFTGLGLLVTYLVIGFVLRLYSCCIKKLREWICYVGRHTLILLVFSPIFTMLSKPLVRVLAFDPSGLLFMFVALSFTLLGCWLIAWCMDRTGISRFFWGRRQMLQPFPFRLQERR